MKMMIQATDSWYMQGIILTGEVSVKLNFFLKN